MSVIKIVCIGDSLTGAYGVAEESSWIHLLSDDLKIQIINSGISGDTTAGMLARFQSMVIEHIPDYVLIMGGTNDLSLNICVSHILGNLLAMTRLARHHQITAIIGIPPPLFCEDSASESRVFISPRNLKKRLELFQISLIQFAKEGDLIVVDFSLNMNQSYFLEDGLHLNEIGHRMMKENAKIVLSNLL